MIQYKNIILIGMPGCGKSAVGRALMGEDISQGALYFAARKYADSGKMKWFDENLTYLFVHGGHEFFR